MNFRWTALRRGSGVAALLMGGAVVAGANPIFNLNYYIDVFGSGVATTTAPGAPNCGTTVTCVMAPAGPVTIDIPSFVSTNLPGNQYTVLQSVDLIVSWASAATVEVTNTNSSSEAFTGATASVPLTISGPESVSVTGLSGPVNGSVGGATTTPTPVYMTVTDRRIQCNALGGTYNDPSAGECTYVSGTTTTTVDGQASFGTTQTIGSGSNGPILTNLSQYELGVLPVVFMASAGDASFGGTETGRAGDLFFGGTGVIGGTLDVDYTYTSQTAPEPVTQFLVGGALLVIGMRLRRKSCPS